MAASSPAVAPRVTRIGGRIAAPARVAATVFANAASIAASAVGRALRRFGALRALAVLLLALGASQIGAAAWIHAKAWLAQQLIDAAWQRNRAALAQAAGTTPSDPIAMARPWAWADTTPVARLEFPALGRSLIVLAGESGRTLAFGPGHRPGTPWPAHDGNAVVSGHRDTHFALLRRLQVGDAIDAESIGGRRLRYRVVQLLVTDKHAVHLTADRGQTELTLVTCWPFDAAAAGGPGRYVVRAVRADR